MADVIHGLGRAFSSLGELSHFCNVLNSFQLCSWLITVVTLPFLEQAWGFLEVVLLAGLGWIFPSLVTSSEGGVWWSITGAPEMICFHHWVFRRGCVMNLGVSESCQSGL